eukprot:scaffold7340_cov266-Pinguiococcus_pyrenoidosus.AAC.35
MEVPTSASLGSALVSSASGAACSCQENEDSSESLIKPLRREAVGNLRLDVVQNRLDAAQLRRRDRQGNVLCERRGLFVACWRTSMYT